MQNHKQAYNFLNKKRRFKSKVLLAPDFLFPMILPKIQRETISLMYK